MTRCNVKGVARSDKPKNNYLDIFSVFSADCFALTKQISLWKS